MSDCPRCQRPIADPAAWICPHCEHILDAGVLGDLGDADETVDEDTGAAGATLRAALGVDAAVSVEEDTALEDAPEARIIGELGDETDEISAVVSRAELEALGSNRVALYGQARSLLALRPGAVPQRVPGAKGRATSALEVLALSLVDGVCTVDALRTASGRARADVDGALLVLLDKGLLTLGAAPEPTGASSALDPVFPSEMTAEDAGEGSSAILPRPHLRHSSLPPAAPPPAALASPPPRKGLPAPIRAASRAPSLRGDGMLEGSFTPPPRPALRAPTPAPAPAPAPLAPTPAPLAPALPPIAPAAPPLPRGPREAPSPARATPSPEAPPARVGAAPEARPRAGKVEPPREKPRPARYSQREVLLHEANDKEAAGDIDGAIALLERAIVGAKDPAIFNRLGVLLATKKKDLARGRELLERAVSAAPTNETYQSNLSKVLTRQAALDLSGRRGGAKPSPGGGGLFSLFGKKK